MSHAIFFSVPIDAALPEDAVGGDVLLGNASFAADEPSPAMRGKHEAGGYLLKYVLGSAAKYEDPKIAKEKKDAEEREKNAETRSSMELLSDSVREAQLAHLVTLRSFEKKEDYVSLLTCLLKDRPNSSHTHHIPHMPSQG